MPKSLAGLISGVSALPTQLRSSSNSSIPTATEPLLELNSHPSTINPPKTFRSIGPCPPHLFLTAGLLRLCSALRLRPHASAPTAKTRHSMLPLLSAAMPDSEVQLLFLLSPLLAKLRQSSSTSLQMMLVRLAWSPDHMSAPPTQT